jgi:hypothetical protein
MLSILSLQFTGSDEDIADYHQTVVRDKDAQASTVFPMSHRKRDASAEEMLVAGSSFSEMLSTAIGGSIPGYAVLRSCFCGVLTM